jgi:hypothetical protein
MHIVTVATENKGYFPVLKASCDNFGVQLSVLGWGKPFTGFTMKFRLMRDFLMSLHPDDNGVYCFVDAYDTFLINRPPASIEHNKVVIAIDYRATWVLETIARMFFGTCNGLRLNSGTYMGRRLALLRMLTELLTLRDKSVHDQTDDQQLLTEYCTRTKSAGILIDTHLEHFIVWSSHIQTSEDLSRSPFTVLGREVTQVDTVRALSFMAGVSTPRMSRTRPFVVHAAGNADIDYLATKLGYCVQDLVRVDKYSHALNHFKNGIYSRTGLNWTGTVQCVLALAILIGLVTILIGLVFFLRQNYLCL